MGSEFSSRKLLSPEREKLIIDSLDGGIRTIAELSTKLGVSEATVRRDLQSLEDRRLGRRMVPPCLRCLLKSRGQQPLR